MSLLWKKWHGIIIKSEQEKGLVTMCVFVFAALPIVYKKIHIIKCGWVGQLTIIQIDNYENAYDNHINVHRL